MMRGQINKALCFLGFHSGEWEAIPETDKPHPCVEERQVCWHCGIESWLCEHEWGKWDYSGRYASIRTCLRCDERDTYVASQLW